MSLSSDHIGDLIKVMQELRSNKTRVKCKYLASFTIQDILLSCVSRDKSSYVF